MRNLASFSIGSVIKKLNRIHVQINSKHNRPFPKPRFFWLSEYTYKRRYIKIHPDGRIAGGLSRFVSSLADFSFIRSIVAHKYKVFGFAYDPVSLFLLELFRYLEKFPDMKAFVEVVRDREKGKHYRLYAGIKYPNLPCEGTFTNLKDRLGEDLYNHILHVLVEIAELLGFLSYKIIATDGTLFPTNARYKGCTYFCDKCNFIEFKGIIENVRQRILYRLNHPEKIVPGKEIRIKVPCPSSNFPDDVKRPKVEVLTLFLKEADPERLSVFNRIFALEKELHNAGLDLIVKRGVITRIEMGESIASDAFFFRCPKLPADMEARIGVRRDPQNPNRKQKIFGFNAVIDTSIEMDLGLELPVACSTLAGNAHEGKHYIINRKQILQYHEKTSKIDLADAKYDEHDNFAFSRSHGAIPIIDYNTRNEKITAAALKERGYDRNGWPYAPCGILTRPNGFDFNCQRASFTCRRQCVKSKDPAIVRYSQDCHYWINYHGFTKHMSVQKFPRLITEVIRGTDRHQKLKTLRSAAERTNATAKEDFRILAKPKVRGLGHAGILSQMAVIVVLLKRIACFIIKVTLALRKGNQNNKSPTVFFVPGPSVPKFILNLVQRE
ncbi:MAG TPA: transposase [Thermodesulforhabdus norvegica]|uniref:Transposase n=1 Tax=Thermodesulforhabdus norvegica TaxID=39841 RepID=A0A7C0WR27_9BACT|nr:transposase [Thermodesulforhabdus norvegica]